MQICMAESMVVCQISLDYMFRCGYVAGNIITLQYIVVCTVKFAQF